MDADTIAFGNCRYKVSDLSAAKEFYSKAFDIKPYFDEPTWVVFEIQNYQLWLEPDNLTGESVYESTNPFYQSFNHRMLTFWQVDDISAICKQFQKLGGTIIKAPKKEGPFTHAIVLDLWGNKVGVHSKLPIQ